MDLFHQVELESRSVPLADRMRPRNLNEFVGQEHILGPGKPLRTIIEKDQPYSIIFWGPPGTGKTTLARIIASTTGAKFVGFSAVVSGIQVAKKVIAQARQEREAYGDRRTILFVDEIHRLNKAQQDAFLPHVEDGTIILIGATTENPSFEIISALLSRTRVFVLNLLSEEELKTVVRNALGDGERGLGTMNVQISPKALDCMISMANGDARKALNTLEISTSSVELGGDGVRRVTLEVVEEVEQRRIPIYDKGGEEHYNVISAFHKSLRGSDPDAALYWLVRMLSAGEDPLYIARRMVRFASEDVGNADPRSLTIAIAAKDAFDFLGSPEGELALAQAAVYLATAPKSNSVYSAYQMAQEDVQKSPSLPVPLHIRNAPTQLMKELGYGKGYKYAHDSEDSYIAQEYMPDNLAGAKYYCPTEHGYEKKITEMMKWWESLRKAVDSSQ